jgi:phosphohistidine swiveling domain-containing protein
MEKDLSDEFLKIIGNRKLYSPLNGYSAFIQGSEYNIQKYYKKWYDDKVKLDLFVHMKEGYSQIWLPEDDIKFASEFVLSEYLNKGELFEQRDNFMLKNIQKIDEIYNEYTYKKIESTDWNKLFSLINEIRDLIWDANAAVIFTIYLDKHLCTSVLKKEQYPFTEKELDAIWEKATEPAFESFDKAQLADFLNLVKNNVEWTEILEQCQYMLSDYHSTKSLSEVEKMLQDKYPTSFNNQNVAEELLNSETQEIDNTESSYQVWFQNLSEKEKIVAYYLQTVMKIRDRRKNFFAKGMTILYRIAEKMFKEEGVDPDLIPYYTIRELLKGNSYLKSSIDVLKDRKNGFQWMVPYVGEPTKLNTNIDNSIHNMNKYFEECHISKNNIDIIKGQPGFKGKIEGKVRIVLNANSNHDFVNGEILVTGMTRPEFIPLMKKASAIITDEGGITCHAAIVSRELKIPCIIGTKIATKVLKTGDLVEVDADNGIVKIIN